MKGLIFSFVMMLLLFSAISSVSGGDKNKAAVNNSYFPADENITLIYQTSFGESVTKYIKDGPYVISNTEADNFKYRQSLLINDSGVYVKDTYQYLKLLLFVKKENMFTYNKPLLRFPFPLTKGKEWGCEGIEYLNGDSNKVTVKGKVAGFEKITVSAGTYDTIRLETVVDGTAGRNSVTEWLAEGVGLIRAKIILSGGGIMGLARDLLGYGEINFELKEIKKN